MRQVEGLDIILKKIFSKMRISDDSVISEANILEVNDLLKQRTGLSLTEIANSNDEEFLTCLLEKKLRSSDMSYLIDVFVDLAKEGNAEVLGFNAIDLARKALFIEDYISKSQKTVYFGNVDSVGQAQNLVNKKK